MADNQLRDFFREKKKKAKPTDIDWAGKRDALVKAVEDLYRKVEDDFLEPAKAEVEVSRLDSVVSENFVGEYHIPELVLRVADEQVVFSPKGVNVVGAKGRIDVHGDRGDAMIVWQGGDEWSIVASRTPALRLIPLTADSFEAMLRDIMRP